MRTLGLAALLAFSAPAVTQVVPPPTPAPVDPARLAAARPVVERLWPLGTYRRMMSATLDRLMNGMIGQMLGMRAGDLAAAGGTKAGAAATLGDATLGDVAKAADPAFDQRMRITVRVMFDEIGRLMGPVEPDVRDALAHALARRFDASELAQLDAFFTTPTGARYASESMLLGTDPEMTAAMAKFLPMFLEAMPGIAKKVEAATAHLPPPPKPAGTEDAK